MYVGEWNLSNVSSFLDGFTYSLYSEGEDRVNAFLSNFPGFYDWVASKYGFRSSTSGWRNMILAVEMGVSPEEYNWKSFSVSATEDQHKASVLKFFELVKEYKSSI